MEHNQLTGTIHIAAINNTQSSSPVLLKTEQRQSLLLSERTIRISNTEKILLSLVKTEEEQHQSMLLSELSLSYNNITGPIDFITNLSNPLFCKLRKKDFTPFSLVFKHTLKKTKQYTFSLYSLL